MLNATVDQISRPMRYPDLPVAHPPLEIELVVVPTFNERKACGAVLERLNTALTDIPWEAIFVDDDSPMEQPNCFAKSRNQVEICASNSELADGDCRGPASKECSHHRHGFFL